MPPGHAAYLAVVEASRSPRTTSLRGSQSRRKAHHEAAPGAVVGHAYGPPVRLDEATHDGQAEARSGVRSWGPGTGATPTDLEDRRHVRGVDPPAGVGHGELDHLADVPPLHEHPAAGRCRAIGVNHEVPPPRGNGVRAGRALAVGSTCPPTS